MKNDYYVYLHKTLDGKVFYVGKGRLKRAWSKSNRGKNWREVSDKGYSVEIHRGGLSEQDALEIESDLIRTLPELINTRLLSPVKFDDYQEYFRYDPTSPSGLTRIKGVFNGKYETGKLGHCGCKFNRKCGGKHWSISFKNKEVLIHRIIWTLFYGEVPDGFVIDHIDGDSLNNIISNLRLTTQAENRRNTRKFKNNTSGVSGVNLQTQSKGKCSYWCAQYTNLDGQPIQKSFSILNLGNEEAFRLACEWRTEQIRLLNEQGAGYTERHGT